MNPILHGPSLALLLMVIAWPTTKAADPIHILQQTILEPRHPDRPVEYYDGDSELPKYSSKTHGDSEVPSQIFPRPRLWKEERLDSNNNQNDDDNRVRRMRYDWHVHVDMEWEGWTSSIDDEEYRRRNLQSRTHPIQTSFDNNQNRGLWSRALLALSSLTSKYSTRVISTTTSTTKEQQRRTSDTTPESGTSSSSSSSSSSSASNASGYEVVNHDKGNGTEDDEVEEADYLDLYPYVDINSTDLNTTDNEDNVTPVNGVDSTGDDANHSTGEDTDSVEVDSNRNNNNSTSAGNSTRRFAPLRIRGILTDALEVDTGDVILNATEREFLLMNILKPAMVAWGEALRVRRVRGNLTLDPQQLIDGQFCGPGPSVKVPEEHTTIGIPDTDFVLYLHVARRSDLVETDQANTTEWDGGHNETLENNDTANTTDNFDAEQSKSRQRKFDPEGQDEQETVDPAQAPVDASYLCSGDYIAASAFCNTDQYDRPLAAILHLCLDDDFFKPDRLDLNIRTVMHELGHSLGFNAISLAHFRRFDGTPRTPRLANGAVRLQRVLCTGPQDPKPGSFDGFSQEETKQHEQEPLDRLLRLGEGSSEESFDAQQNSSQTTGEVGYYDSIPLPSEEVLQFRTVRRGVRVAQIVTPSVLQVARNHFGCQTLMGAELESGENTCLGDHWERRLFKTDLMNPIIDSDAPFSSRISTITLAYFADSGWYQVDLSRASVAASWGRGAGCSFVEEPCIGQDGEVSPGLDSLFCSSQTIGLLTLDGCTHDLLKKASCRMDQYTEQLPQAYQYFDHTYGSHVGGLDPFVDYCPVYTGFNNGMCSDRNNEAFIKVSPMERVGSPNSRCLAGVLPFGKTALCLRIACVVNDKSLRVQIDNSWYTCTHQGQRIYTRIGVKVECPDPVRTCPTFYCPRDCLGTPELMCDYGQGECVCPVNQTIPRSDGSCPSIPSNETAYGSSDGDPGPGGQDITSGGTAKYDDPFYWPSIMHDDTSVPEETSFIQDIYFPDERSLIEQARKEDGIESRWRWPAVGGGAFVLVSALAILYILHSKKRSRSLPISTYDLPDSDDDPNSARRQSPRPSFLRSEKMKMMATVVVDLRLQEQFSDVFVQDTNTDAASMTDTEGDQSFGSPPTPPRMPEEYLRPTIVRIPPPQPLEIDISASRSALLRRRRRRRFF